MMHLLVYSGRKMTKRTLALGAPKLRLTGGAVIQNVLRWVIWIALFPMVALIAAYVWLQFRLQEEYDLATGRHTGHYDHEQPTEVSPGQALQGESRTKEV